MALTDLHCALPISPEMGNADLLRRSQHNRISLRVPA